ncbi:MAG: hypothetical protein OEY58_10695 [Gammaproteobacteria bacterium]|nr:hypothetical protein [Gammaproteobacteria bacterium]
MNSENSRKRIICDSVENLAGYKEEKGCYDVVFFNWLLHHLVGDSYSETIKNIKSCISESKHLLSARGRISIFENNYDGILIDTLPSYMVFQLTSMKAIAPITRKLGANTAGVGVCFLSRKSWEQVIQDSGLSLQDYSEELKRTIPFHRKLLLHLRDLNIGHYWCGVNK